MLSSIDDLIRVRNFGMGLYKLWLAARGIDIHDSAKISLSARFECGRPGAISIGELSQIAFKTLLYTTDPVSRQVDPIKVGNYCFIGGGSLIGPGVTIGDGAVVGGGSIVMDDVPSRCVVAGNPSRIIRSDIPLAPYGRFAGSSVRLIS